jgi:hypothetical protein
VVVTVDEGDSFRGGDSRRDPTKTNLGDIAFIPLFVKLPGKENGGVVERHVTSVDILPTIASVLGVKIKWRVDGRSVLAPGAGSRTVRVGKFSSSYRTAQSLRQRARERKLRLFGSGSWGPKLSATGRYRELVGKQVSSLARAGNALGAGNRRRPREPAPAQAPEALAADPFTAGGHDLGTAARRHPCIRAQRTDRCGVAGLPRARHRRDPLLGASARVRLRAGTEPAARVRRHRPHGYPCAQGAARFAIALGGIGGPATQSRFRQALLGRGRAVARNEQPAMRALEAAGARRGRGNEELSLELLSAVRAHDSKLLGHSSKLADAQRLAGGSSSSSSEPVRAAKRAASRARSSSK